MGIQVPPAKNYSSPLIPITSIVGREPIEGRKTVPCEIDWGTMASAENAVAFNLQALSTQEFSQICAISVDNSGSGADVTFIFTDTSETVTIPKLTPKAIIEVFTNTRSFYVYAPNAESEDVTRFSMLNFVPPPIVLPITRDLDFASFNNIDASTVAATQIIPNTISGTIVAINITVNIGNVSGNKTAVFDVIDSVPEVFFGGNVANFAGNNSNFLITDLTDLSLPFEGGLQFNITSTDLPSGSIFSVNVYYRTP